MNYRIYPIITRLSLIVFLSVCYTANVWCQEVKATQIERRNRIAYLKGSATPFTGKVVDSYKNGSKKSEENFVAGMKEGLLKTWFG